MPVPQQCFVSYAHKDHAGFERMRAHLSPIAPLFGMTLWHDRRLQAGDYWNHRIESEIGRSNVFVLLATADFFDSGYILNHELPAIIKRHSADGALVIPVIHTDCFWRPFFGHYIQAVPVTLQGQLRPVGRWRPKEDGYAAAAQAIAAAIEDWFGHKPTSPLARLPVPTP